MKQIDSFIQDYKTLASSFDFENSINYCNTLFTIMTEGTAISGSNKEDIFLAAKAFTSIINHLVNKKTEYAQSIIHNQIELLEFLNTFDDNYLSNMSNLLSEILFSELAFVEQLNDDVNKLINFCADVLEMIFF